MLSYTPMKNLAGIRLEGDYLSLRNLHEIVHKLDKQLPQQADHSEMFLGLAYDVRKAFSQARDIIQPPAHSPEIGLRFGVKIIWPALMFQIRQMRTALAYGPSESRDHAAVYELEQIVEDAVTEIFPDQFQYVLQAWRSVNPLHPQAPQKQIPLGGMFCSWTAEQRQTHMGALLYAFSAMNGIHAHRNPNGITDEDIAAWGERDWVDPETGK